MKSTKPRTHWIIDAVLFVGFLVAYFVDLTGVDLHQILGIGLSFLVIYHLMAHWQWVEAVTERFFGRTSRQARSFYILDAALTVGCFLILVTGLLISPWLDLPLGDFATWSEVHLLLSIATSLIVALKLMLHWRWIVSTAKKHIFAPAQPAVNAQKLQPVAVTVGQDRREFFRLLAVVGGGTAVAILAGARSLTSAEAVQTEAAVLDPAQASTAEMAAAFKSGSVAQSSTGTIIPLATVTATAAAGSQASGATNAPKATATATTAPKATATPVPSSQSATAPKQCIIRCNRNCSYPGRCRRYADANRNNRCDLSECA